MQTARIRPVLMSGGSGTRLWPLSRRKRPKQFAAVLGDRTLFQETMRRVSGAAEGLDFLPPIVVGAAPHADLIRAELDEAGAQGARLILEPAPRNTAPCAAAAAVLAVRDADDSLVLLLPCDHAVTRPGAFHAALARAAPAAQAGRIVTFGMAPDGPETAYGYIRQGQALAGAHGVFAVSSFAEKPDAARARAYLDEGGWHWNAGIFLFRPDAMIAELRRHAPDILDAAQEALDRARAQGEALLLDEGAFSACRAESIDYAVMEKTESAAVAPADMGWSDVGLWSSVWTLSDKDGSGIAASGDVIAADSRNCLVSTDGPPVLLAGVEDLVVVARDGMVMVTRRDTAGSVKTLVESLAARKRDDLL